MVYKILTVLIDVIFPKTYLEKYLASCSQMELERRLTPRMQKQERVFSPYHYMDPFVKDCVIELKERSNRNVGRLFGKKIAEWMRIMMDEVLRRDDSAQFCLVPVPQHRSKTREKGFEHAKVLAEEIHTRIGSEYPARIFPCLEKVARTKRLHDLSGRNSRFKTIKNTMRAHVTKGDARHLYFFIIDDVYTTGATYKEARSSLTDCCALPERMFFVSIAH